MQMNNKIMVIANLLQILFLKFNGAFTIPPPD